jgi:sugar/nucleoside kinase (ribokinase family)
MTGKPEPPIAIVGNLNVDQVVSTVTRFPAWDEELLVGSSRLEVAGTAGYLALTARGLGMAPFVVSTVGEDANAAFLREGLAAAGIDADGVETIPDTETCLGIIFVGDQGQRGILTVLGAHEEMSVAVAERHDDRIRLCPEVFLCGNYLLPRFTPHDAVPYARRLRERGQVVVFDPSWDPGGWSRQTREETLALMEYVDLYLPNEQELCHLTSTSTWREGVKALGNRAGQVVVKRGADGAVSIQGESIVECPGLPLVAANTTGAGDVFDMAFLYSRRKRWETGECLLFACAAAGAVIVQEGTREYPDEAAVWAFATANGAGSRC